MPNSRLPTAGLHSPDVIVVDHHDSYTWNLVHLIAAVSGTMPVVVQHDEASAEDVLSHDFVVLSPGPGHPDNDADFEVGRQVLLAGSRPVLGVCLGMQGLVSTFGGTVERIEPAHGEPAHVTHDGTGLFSDLANPLAVIRYHSLAATLLPPCLEVTARSQDHVVMGVRHRELPLTGVQFHPESILSQGGATLIANFLQGRR